MKINKFSLQMNFFKQKRLSLGYSLLILLLIIVGMISIRIIISGELRFVFLIWNLFLATIPLYISTVLGRNNPVKKRFFVLLIALIWLLFYPNAPYLITDLFHLKDRPGIPLWYDLILLWLSAILGLSTGILSLSQMETIFERKINLRWRTFIKYSFHFLIAYGVYLGRYLRWNTWDVIINPMTIVKSLKTTLSLDCIAFTLIFGTIHLLFYQFVKSKMRLTEQSIQ